MADETTTAATGPGAKPVVRRNLLPRIDLASLKFAPTLAAIILGLIVLAAVFAPLIAPYDPIKMDPMARLGAASFAHPFGTDGYGRDVLSRTLYGARTSLIVGLGAAFVAVLIGLPLGLLSGFFRVLDAVLMTVCAAAGHSRAPACPAACNSGRPRVSRRRVRAGGRR